MKISELKDAQELTVQLATFDTVADQIGDDNCQIVIGKASMPISADDARKFFTAQRQALVKKLNALGVQEDATMVEPAEDKKTTSTASATTSGGSASAA